jgi:hypothetical protein
MVGSRQRHGLRDAAELSLYLIPRNNEGHLLFLGKRDRAPGRMAREPSVSEKCA